MTKLLHNMGGYCHSHGFHPVGLNHNSHTCTYKKEGHKDEATWCNRLGGDLYWPTAKRTALEQHEDPAWKGKTAPTVWQGPGTTSVIENTTACNKIIQSLSNNYYACLSPPPCQVEEHETNTTKNPTVTFNPSIDIEPTVSKDIAVIGHTSTSLEEV